MWTSGSPAQIEWAERIKASVDAEFSRVAAAFRSVANKQNETKRRKTELILAILEDKRAETMAHQDAAYFITQWQEISDQVRRAIAQDSRF